MRRTVFWERFRSQATSATVSNFEDGEAGTKARLVPVTFSFCRAANPGFAFFDGQASCFLTQDGKPASPELLQVAAAPASDR